MLNIAFFIVVALALLVVLSGLTDATHHILGFIIIKGSEDDRQQYFTARFIRVWSSTRRRCALSGMCIQRRLLLLLLLGAKSSMLRIFAQWS